MFNGIIYNQGTISKIKSTKGGLNIFVKSKINVSKKDIGLSIACDGVCLTLVSKKKNISEFYLSKETIIRSKFKNIKINDKINIELPLIYGQKISGHICQGHVDTTAVVKNISSKGKSKVLEFTIPNKFKKDLIEKASILINGVSLTISKISKTYFQINVIPHTLKLTNLKNLKIKDYVNVELDIFSKYISKLS